MIKPSVYYLACAVLTWMLVEPVHATETLFEFGPIREVDAFVQGPQPVVCGTITADGRTSESAKGIIVKNFPSCEVNLGCPIWTRTYRDLYIALSGHRLRGPLVRAIRHALPDTKLERIHLIFPTILNKQAHAFDIGRRMVQGESYDFYVVTSSSRLSDVRSKTMTVNQEIWTADNIDVVIETDYGSTWNGGDPAAFNRRVIDSVKSIALPGLTGVSKTAISYSGVIRVRLIGKFSFLSKEYVLNRNY